jgi:transposase
LAATERSDSARREWRAALADRDPSRFVFLDESSTNVCLTPAYAWAPRSQRAHGTAPRNHGQNTTLVAALTPTGLQAPMTLLGAMDSDAFAAYVREFLLPTLTPGTIVILDNLSVHKRADIRALVDAAGCQLVFLPPYSPDFNPIELVFSKLKTRLRRLAARTQVALEEAIAEALTTISAHDAIHDFAHCGYQLKDQSL